MSEPLTYTVEEAAKLLRIGRSAAYIAAREGQLPVLRVGRRLLVPRHRLDELLGVLRDNEPAVNGLAVTKSAGTATDDNSG